jgi:hypothetical protein
MVLSDCIVRVHEVVDVQYDVVLVVFLDGGWLLGVQYLLVSYITILYEEPTTTLRTE